MRSPGKIKKRTIYVLKWVLISALIGAVVGAAGFVFDKLLEIVTELRQENSWLIFFLPVAGLMIIWFYHIAGFKDPKGTNRIFVGAKKGDNIPVKVAPLIAGASALTHLTGGSAGREGAALQLGGSIANGIGRTFKLSHSGIQEATVCGMSAGFAALFGTPMVSAVFALEVLSNQINYAALLPSFISAITAAEVSKALGTVPMCFNVTGIPLFSVRSLLTVILLGLAAALLSMLFCTVMEKTGELYKKYIRNQYIRVVVGGFIVMALTLILGTRDYNGAGTDVIKRAFAGEAVPYAFILKLLFTALSLGAGFKGGEIVPTFFVGSTFGAAFAPLLGLSPSFGAGLCMVALFAGVTNCPLASIFMACEFFGDQGLIYWAVVCIVSYTFSSHFSLYSAQELPEKIFYDKNAVL